MSGLQARLLFPPFFLFAALSPRHSARVHKRSTGRCLSAAPMPTVLIKLRPTHEAGLRLIFAPAVEHLHDGIEQSLSDVADQASMVRSSLEPFRKFRTDGIALGRIQEPRARVSSPCAATWRTISMRFRRSDLHDLLACRDNPWSPRALLSCYSSSINPEPPSYRTIYLNI